MLTAVVGHSEETEPGEVADEVLEQCRAKLGATPARAGLLFAAIDFDHQVILDAIGRRYPGLELIGCTTDGEVSSELGFCEDSATLILFASDTVDITAGVGRGLSRDVVGACRAAVQQSKGKTQKPPRLCLSAPEGLTAEGQSITATLQDAVGVDVPIVGALAGDQWRLKSTRQFCRHGSVAGFGAGVVVLRRLSVLLRCCHGMAPGRRSRTGDAGVGSRRARDRRLARDRVLQKVPGARHQAGRRAATGDSQRQR